MTAARSSMFDAAIEAIDDANAGDPNTIVVDELERREKPTTADARRCRE